MDRDGQLIRAPDALRPLTVCSCDCKILTPAVCAGFPRYSQECIHPSQRCVAKRIMTDNVFEMETAAFAHRACFLNVCGVLLTDFSCADPSVDHRWILTVLQRAHL